MHNLRSPEKIPAVSNSFSFDFRERGVTVVGSAVVDLYLVIII